MAQVVEHLLSKCRSHKFKPQYCQKEKKKKKAYQIMLERVKYLGRKRESRKIFCVNNKKEYPVGYMIASSWSGKIVKTRF
jgi:hypothetical protein